MVISHLEQDEDMDGITTPSPSKPKLLLSKVPLSKSPVSGIEDVGNIHLGNWSAGMDQTGRALFESIMESLEPGTFALVYPLSSTNALDITKSYRGIEALLDKAYPENEIDSAPPASLAERGQTRDISIPVMTGRGPPKLSIYLIQGLNPNVAHTLKTSRIIASSTFAFITVDMSLNTTLLPFVGRLTGTIFEPKDVTKLLVAIAICMRNNNRLNDIIRTDQNSRRMADDQNDLSKTATLDYAITTLCTKVVTVSQFS
jgi:hypothetical protein